MKNEKILQIKDRKIVLIDAEISDNINVIKRMEKRITNLKKEKEYFSNPLHFLIYAGKDQKILDWCFENNIVCKWHYKYKKHFIIFKNIEDASACKLYFS